MARPAERNVPVPIINYDRPVVSPFLFVFNKYYTGHAGLQFMRQPAFHFHLQFFMNCPKVEAHWQKVTLGHWPNSRVALVGVPTSNAGLHWLKKSTTYTFFGRTSFRASCFDTFRPN